MSPNFYFSLREDIKSICEADNLITSGSLVSENFLPTRADPEATGYDVRCAIDKGLILKPGCYFKIPLGFRMFAPQGWWLNLAPRSSTFMKKHIHALYGIIDETYENEMVFVGQYIPDDNELLPLTKDLVINFGERIAQLVPIARQDMSVNSVSKDELEKMYTARSASRGKGGFGASGIY